MLLVFDTEFMEDGRVIDLLSIGVVRDDGEEYYAEVPAPTSRANDWVRANVLPYLGAVKKRPREHVAKDIVEFAGAKPQWWAWYADYDWVALCQLYGRMVDLPEGWPMYCRDIKQLADELMGDFDLSHIPRGREHHALDDARWGLAVLRWLRSPEAHEMRSLIP